MAKKAGVSLKSKVLSSSDSSKKVVSRAEPAAKSAGVRTSPKSTSPARAPSKAPYSAAKPIPKISKPTSKARPERATKSAGAAPAPVKTGAGAVVRPNAEKPSRGGAAATAQAKGGKPPKPDAAPKPVAAKPASPPGKPAAKGGKSTGKTGGKPGAKGAPEGPRPRYSVLSAESIAASRAAAARLAAAAGLHPVRASSNGDSEETNYTKLSKSPFGKKDLREFREVLLEKRRQLCRDVNSMESEALTGSGSGSLSHLPQHMADQGTDTFDQSLALDLAASQRGLLKEIDDALTRIEKGNYGICEMLGKSIQLERLRHTPWARFCIEAARRLERTTYHK